MSSLSRNIAANLLATGWTSLVQLAVVPVLISMVGVASYALVGLYGTMLGTLAILDLGLAPSLMRKMAIARAGEDDLIRAANTLRTYEAVYCAVGVVVGAGIALCAPLIAGAWLSSSTLREADIRDSILLMGLLFALRWPLTPYVASLLGMQKQVGLNVVNAVAGTIASAGGIAVLALVSPSIEVFFAWQCVCAAAQLAALHSLAWRKFTSASAPPRFARATLLDGWRFATGMTGIVFTAIILTQGDKLLLSKLVPLEEFGYYSVAFGLAGALHLMMLPMFNAVMPRLAELVARGDEKGLLESFTASTGLMNALVIPVALWLALFSEDLLMLWLRDPHVAARAAPLLALLATGALLNCFMNVPFALQLARGNTALGLSINAALCLLMIPAILVLTDRYGILGGAAVSPILNGLYVIVGLPATYRRCLPGARWTEFYLNLARQQGAAILLLAAARWLLPPGVGAVAQLAALALALLLALTLAVGFTPAARVFLVEQFGIRPHA